jgi:16S rRNA (guanine1516-N2)-methyltransferase
MRYPKPHEFLRSGSSPRQRGAFSFLALITLSPTTPTLHIAVSAEPLANATAAAALALEFGLPWVIDPAVATTPRFTHLLIQTAERLELRELGADAPGPVYVDFTGGVVAHRRRFGGGRNQPLARAAGLKSGATPTVVDATAGLGRDAFVLASLGCAVQLIERAPIIAALLRDGLQRAARDPDIGPLITERLRLITADGRDYLRELAGNQRPEVVYLDPMYPHRQKTALVKKEMRLLRQWVGDDDDAPELLAAALRCAQRRVVVKRPRQAPMLAGPPPGFQIVAPNTRFDVYLLNRDSLK